MIVCSCHRLTDGDIRHAHGPQGSGYCPAGTGCGNCLPVVSAIVNQVTRDSAEPVGARSEGSAPLEHGRPVTSVSPG